MPVSHLGLTVSHIPSATSFYLAALQPLGYRFIGHQGNSIGLGVVSADFFLTQSPIGARISPNHIAFLAEDRNIVRECYAAALNSGGHPSGSPNYRNGNCTCFNAAVEDLDGNTIEFIFRQPHGDASCCGEAAEESEQAIIQDEEDVENAVEQEEDSRSIARSIRSQDSRQSRARSSMQTALNLASTTSKAMKSEAPTQGISRTNTAPASSSFPSRTLMGTALGAAAGAALMYAMSRAERANAKDEANHAAYMMSTKPRSRSETRQTKESRTMPPPPAPSVRTRSMAQPAAPISYPAPPSVRDTRKFHRNFSTTESAFSTRHPAPQTTQAMRMLEATGHNDEDEDVQEALGRYNSLRAMPTRSKTQDDYAYAPASQAGRSESRRASKMPVESYDAMQYLINDSKSTTSRHSRSARPDAPLLRSSSHTSSRHRREDDQIHRRNDSGVSIHSSSRSHRHHRQDRESDTGRSNTIKPTTTSRRDSFLPSPPSKAPSLLIETAAYFPAAISLPASSVASSSKRQGKGIAALPPKLNHSEQSWEQFTAGEESDGLGDIKTVVPDDSISCVDLSKPRRRRRERGEGSESGRSHRGSESGRSHHRDRKHDSSSRRSEAASESTVKPARKGTVVGQGKGRIFGF